MGFWKEHRIRYRMALGLSPKAVALTSCLALGRSLTLSVLRFIHTQNPHAETQCLIQSRRSVSVCWLSEQRNKPVVYFCGEVHTKDERRTVSAASRWRFQAKVYGNGRLLKEPFMTIYVVLGFSLNHLVAGCVAAVASEARPRLHQHLLRLLCL